MSLGQIPPTGGVLRPRVHTDTHTQIDTHIYTDIPINTNRHIGTHTVQSRTQTHQKTHMQMDTQIHITNMSTLQTHRHRIQIELQTDSTNRHNRYIQLGTYTNTQTHANANKHIYKHTHNNRHTTHLSISLVGVRLLGAGSLTVSPLGRARTWFTPRPSPDSYVLQQEKGAGAEAPKES